MTATDSDDQEESGFFDQAYDDAMKMELKSEEAWKGRDMSNLYPSQSFPLNGICARSPSCKLCKSLMNFPPCQYAAKNDDSYPF